MPDTLMQLLLPSDEWYYTNHSTKYARYVKFHAARILVYMGLFQRLGGRIDLFDLKRMSCFCVSGPQPPTPSLRRYPSPKIKSFHSKLRCCFSAVSVRIMFKDKGSNASFLDVLLHLVAEFLLVYSLFLLHRDPRLLTYHSCRGARIILFAFLCTLAAFIYLFCLRVM